MAIDVLSRAGYPRNEQFRAACLKRIIRLQQRFVRLAPLKAISGLPFWTKEGPISVTLSIGAITIKDWNREIPIEPFLKRVDAALYQAKATGRDRVIHTAL